MEAVVSDLSMDDLVRIIGHREWKGFAVGRQKIVLVAMGAVNERELKVGLEAATKDAVRIKVRDEELPGGYTAKMVDIEFTDRLFHVDNLSTGSMDMYPSGISRNHSFFIMTAAEEGQPGIFELGIGQSQDRVGTTADGKGKRYRITREV